MYISLVKIHNFRSIADGTFNLNSYSLVIGANNSGKSNFIDAIRVFYDDPKFNSSTDCPKFEYDGESWIELEFALTDEEYDGLAEQYRLPNNRLRVRKVLQTAEDRKPGIYGYKTDGNLADELTFGARNVQQGKFGHPIYIPAASTLDEHTKLTGPSPLRDLVQQIFKTALAKSPSYNDLVKQFGTFAEQFKSETTDDGQSLASVEQEINRELEEWGVSLNFHVDAISEDDLMKRLLSVQLQDQVLEDALHPERYGHGLQRHLIYSLIRLSAAHAKPKPPKNKKDFAPSLTLILFEEPEAFLHPTQQLALYQSLQDLSNQEGYQIIASSHSPYFVSFNVDDIPSIIRLQRDISDGKTVVGQIGAPVLDRILSDNRAINTILKQSRRKDDHPEREELDAAMEALRYFLWLNPERCGMFFSGYVLLVEGSTERVLLNYLLKTGFLKTPAGGLFILDCQGKYNVHRFMNLLEHLRIPHAVLCDADDGWLHRQLNNLIRDSKNDYTLDIQFLNPDIEGYLGVSKPSHSHRKPESLMLKLTKGQIKSMKIKELVRLIQGMFDG